MRLQSWSLLRQFHTKTDTLPAPGVSSLWIQTAGPMPRSAAARVAAAGPPMYTLCGGAHAALETEQCFPPSPPRLRVYDFKPQPYIAMTHSRGRSALSSRWPMGSAGSRPRSPALGFKARGSRPYAAFKRSTCGRWALDPLALTSRWNTFPLDPFCSAGWLMAVTSRL